MEWWFNNLRYFYLTGSVNAIFFCILILSKHKLSISDKILSLWLIILSLQLLIPFLYLIDLKVFYKFAGVEIALYSIHPLLLYLYIKAISERFPSKKQLVSTLICAALVQLSTFMFFMVPAKERLSILLGNTPIHPVYYAFFTGVIIYFVVFFIKSLQALKDFKVNILHLYSYKENVDLHWLRKLTLFFYGLLTFFMLFGITLYNSKLSVVLGDYLFYAGLSVFIFFLGYWGYKQGKIFSFKVPIEKTVPKRKYYSSNEKKTPFSNDAQKLIKLMETNKPFLNPTLSIFELSKEMCMQPPHLSKLINQEFHNNFFEFINHYRIDEFKSKMLQKKYRDYTLLGTALECGFNSKSAFNRIFKEQTGITPGEYKKKVLIQ